MAPRLRLATGAAGKARITLAGGADDLRPDALR